MFTVNLAGFRITMELPPDITMRLFQKALTEGGKTYPEYR